MLPGANTYTGTTTIGSGATLTLDAASDITYSGAIIGGGDLITEGSGTLTLSGNNALTGAIDIAAGTLKLAGDNTLTAPIDIESNTLELGTPKDWEIHLESQAQESSISIT